MTQNILVFTGRIIPERVAVDVIGLPTLSFGDDPSTLMYVDIFIGCSQIIARVKDEHSSTDLLTLKNQVQMIVATIVDSLGWCNHCAYTIEITACSTPTETQVFGVDFRISDLPDGTIDAVSLSLLLLNDPEGKLKPIRRAMADYRLAILHPDDTQFYCFRAVECLTYYFERNPRRGRPKLSEVLNIEDEWITKNLEIPAGEVRHGKVKPVSERERQEALESARIVLQRFIRFVHTEDCRLSEEEFPRLKFLG